MSKTRELIDSIMSGSGELAREAFSTAITDKVNTVLDIKRVAITADIYNKVDESVSIKKEILNPDVTKDLPEDEEDLDEAPTPGKQADMKRVNAGAMSQDEYNKKYKLGKYRPAGSKLGGPGGLYNNLVKKA